MERSKLPGKAGWKSQDTALEKFRRYAPQCGPNECWPYMRAKVWGGYGRYWDHHGKRAIYAHRMAFELEYGPVPDGLMVAHLCDSPSCTNPNHLFLATCVENKHDSMSKDRHVYGTRQHSAKLCEADIREIREKFEAGLSDTQISKGHGVTSWSIAKIRRGITWKQVK